jgi:Tol biopolymer transport system component
LAASIDVQGAAGQGPVDWSPDGAWIIAGGTDAQGPALFKIPVDGGVPERFVEGAWANPVWSPAGNLIVYAGRSVVGQVQLLAVRPDGAAVGLPNLMVRPGGYRFLPDGSGLVFLPGIHAQDFWLLDFATKQERPLTRLGKQGALRTFDITRDGKFIVFDRSRQNSNVVLIELGR